MTKISEYPTTSPISAFVNVPEISIFKSQVDNLDTKVC
jgi:hypothetical protein